MPAFFRRPSALLAALVLLAAGPGAGAAAAQSSSSASNDAAAAASGDCQTNLSKRMFAENRSGESSTAGSAAPTPAEKRVKQVLSEKGVHVVRLWAPWCSNSTGEMADGAWDGLAANNEDVSFTFVTVWNNGNGGAGTIEKHDLSLDRITEVVPADPEQGRLDTFMGYAVNWVPSTWIFRSDGEGTVERAFAMNYGEMDRSTLQTLIDAAGKDW